MNEIQHFKQKLDTLERMLRKLNSNHSRVKQLKRSVYVLRAILDNENLFHIPYGPATPIAKYSLN